MIRTFNFGTLATSKVFMHNELSEKMRLNLKKNK